MYTSTKMYQEKNLKIILNAIPTSKSFPVLRIGAFNGQGCCKNSNDSSTHKLFLVFRGVTRLHKKDFGNGFQPLNIVS